MLPIETNTLEFFWPWSALFWFLPIFVRFIVPRDNYVMALRVPFFKRITDLPQIGLKDKKNYKNFILSLIVWSFFVIAAMRPQWVGDPTELPVTGRSVMLAVDLSGSMKESDLVLNGKSVSRLEVVKSVLSKFIKRRSGDRLGLILFGSQAYLQTPLTFDLKTISQMLEESELGLAGERTAIGDAIGLAIKKMKDLSSEEKVLILLTDGQNTAGEVSPEDAGLVAKETGLKIHTIGVGADEAWIRTFFGKQRVNPSAELDESMLQSLALKTGGKYFRARNTDELEGIYQMIDKIERIEKEKKVFRPRKSLYVWPLSLGLFSILIWLSILHLKNKSD